MAENFVPIRREKKGVGNVGGPWPDAEVGKIPGYDFPRDVILTLGAGDRKETVETERNADSALDAGDRIELREELEQLERKALSSTQRFGVSLILEQFPKGFGAELIGNRQNPLTGSATDGIKEPRGAEASDQETDAGFSGIDWKTYLFEAQPKIIKDGYRAWDFIRSFEFKSLAEVNTWANVSAGFGDAMTPAGGLMGLLVGLPSFTQMTRDGWNAVEDLESPVDEYSWAYGAGEQGAAVWMAVVGVSAAGQGPRQAYVNAARSIPDKIAKFGLVGEKAKEFAIRARNMLKIKLRKPLGIFAKPYEWRNLWLYKNRVGPQPQDLMHQTLEKVLQSATKTSSRWNWFFGVK